MLRHGDGTTANMRVVSRNVAWLPRLSARGSGLSPCSKILREMVRPPGIPPEDCGASTFLSSEGLDDRLRHGLEPRTWTFRSDALPAGTGPFEQYR